MYERPQRSDELYHWGSNGKHKYIKKIGQGKDTRYFYTMDEVKAYMQGAKKGVQSGVKNVKKFFDPNTAKNYQNKLSDSNRAISNKRFLVRSASENMRDKNRSEGSRKTMAKLKRIEELDLNKELNNREKTRKEYQKKTLSGVVDKITGNSYKKEMKDIKRDLDLEKGSLQRQKEYRDQRLKEKAPGWERSTKLENDNINYTNKKIKDYTNDLNSTKRAYEKNSVAGRIEKGTRETKEAINKTISNAINSAKKTGTKVSNIRKNTSRKANDFITSVVSGESVYTDKNGIKRLKRKKTDQIV